MVDIGHVIQRLSSTSPSRHGGPSTVAIAVAKRYGSRLTVFHVRTAAAPAVAPFPVLAPSAAESLITSAGDHEHWRRQLEAFVPAHTAKGVRIDFSIADGDVAAEVLAQAQPSDLIVIGTHGRSGFEHLVLGSVAEQVLRGAPGPLLTIPRRAADATDAVPGLFHHIVAAVDFSEPSLHALEYGLSLAEEADARRRCCTSSTCHRSLPCGSTTPTVPAWCWNPPGQGAGASGGARGRMQPARIATSRCVSKTASLSVRLCGWRPKAAPVSSSSAPTVAAWSSGCSWISPHSRSSARQRSRC